MRWTGRIGKKTDIIPWWAKKAEKAEKAQDRERQSGVPVQGKKERRRTDGREGGGLCKSLESQQVDNDKRRS